jgi:hypothetical protein
MAAGHPVADHLPLLAGVRMASPANFALLPSLPALTSGNDIIDQVFTAEGKTPAGLPGFAARDAAFTNGLAGRPAKMSDPVFAGPLPPENADEALFVMPQEGQPDGINPDGSSANPAESAADFIMADLNVKDD